MAGGGTLTAKPVNEEGGVASESAKDVAASRVCAIAMAHGIVGDGSGTDVEASAGGECGNIKGGGRVAEVSQCF